MLYVGMARVKSHVIRMQNTSELGQNSWPGIQNVSEVTHKSISSYQYGQKYLTRPQYPAWESAHTQFHDFWVIILFFFSKPAKLACQMPDCNT